jgi:uncharacterized protein
MTPEERQLLTALFDRIGSTASQPRDREAEAFIADALRQHPFAPYVLAQTVIVQDEALRAAAERIQTLEQQAPQDDAPSFLGRPQSRTQSGLPGIGSSQAAAQGGPWGGAASQAQPDGLGGGGAGGGFLRNAMATAAGVAGGALLFQGIQSLFTGKEGGAAGLFGGGADQATNAQDTTFADNFIGRSDQPVDPASDETDLTEASFDHDEDHIDDDFDLGVDDAGDWA